MGFVNEGRGVPAMLSLHVPVRDWVQLATRLAVWVGNLIIASA
jgi:hypothetical protein